MINIETLVEEKLAAWSSNKLYKKFASHYWYCNELEKNSMLFIGINPSTKKNIKIIEKCPLLQEGNTLAYFKRFEDISKHINLNWSHIDLFLFRSTKQKRIYELLKDSNGRNFLNEQLQLANQIIKKINPKVIVVCNALARDFIGKENPTNQGICLGYDLIFDKHIGTYKWKDIPVFMSSMLTGQRALDNGSYERLKWHIKFAIGN